MAHLTKDDIQFLIYAGAALRFQHSDYDNKLKQDGVVQGDAYFLGSEQWNAPDEEKIKEFEARLSHQVKNIYDAFIAGTNSYNGSFLIFSGCESNTELKDFSSERSYGRHGGFVNVGAGKIFSAYDCIGRVKISEKLIIDELGHNPADPSTKDRVIDYLFGKIVSQISTARERVPKLTLDKNAEEIKSRADSQRNLDELRKKFGIGEKNPSSGRGF